jgi:hypothetical protein
VSFFLSETPITFHPEQVGITLHEQWLFGLDTYEHLNPHRDPE